MRLSTGAELRVTGPLDAPAAVVCVNGGQAAEVEGTWSASLEWLVRPLRGKRLRVLHGSLDRALPGIPGVAPELSKRGLARARSLGAEGEYTLIRGGLHGVALRAPSGKLLALPRASTWASLVADELTR